MVTFIVAHPTLGQLSQGWYEAVQCLVRLDSCESTFIELELP